MASKSKQPDKSVTSEDGGETDQSPRKATASKAKPRPSRTAKKAVSSSPAAAPPSADRGFPIVGIGASAGGLEALELLFQNMPSDTGMAYVVVTHQHPGHTSMLPELLGKCTTLPVVEAAHSMQVEPNHVYVCPPGGQLDLLNGRIVRTDAERSEPPHLPIDHFFRSLATDQKERAICIILSGTGTDGTLGLKAIKAESGMAMVQQVQSAKYAGMPSSALATGLADYVLPAEVMPRQLVAYARGPYLAAPALEEMPEVPAEPMQKIFVLLRSRTGHDFSAYKSSTIRRRIERRMNVHQIKRPDHYVRFLQENPREIDTLFKELLISVTNFFRDPEAFELLTKAVLPALLASRPDNYTLRVWAPGCATGEEVYSVAIALREAIEEAKRPFEVQIFGTDLDSAAVNVARTGQYPDGIAVDVPTPRLERYFAREDSGYRVRKDIREMAIFAVQNVIKDPPFTKLDLLICRNLLIYLNTDLQRKLLPLFHYALKSGGVLFLGPSETIGNFGDLFDPVDKKWKIFRRKDSALANTQLVQFPTELTKALPAEAPLEAQRPLRETTQIASLLDKLLIKRFAPASVLVNERGDVAYIHGRTGAYLEPAAGQPRLNILDMAREGLQVELPSLLRQAARQTAEVRHEAVRVRTNGDFTYIDLSIIRLAEPETLRGLFLVTFHPRTGPLEPEKPRSPKGKERESTRVDTLERELQCTKESLQTTIEELETSNEELKSTNEELQSTNEELQSTNEELETSKEEMQSLNEELTTVNAELHAKVEDLSRANDDMQNLLNSTEVATIFLDRGLNINRYTDQARQLVNLIQTDVGRPLADLVSNLEYAALVPDCREVLRTLVFKHAEVQTKDGRWFLMRIMPYRTGENVIDGLVITFVDINPVKRAEEELAATKERLEADLKAMTRLQEIGGLFLRGADLPTILDEVLEAALCVCKTDMGKVDLYDPDSGQLKTVAQRGLKKSWLAYWADVNGSGLYRAALNDGNRFLVEDVTQSAIYAEKPERDIQLAAGIHAEQMTPMVSPSGKLLGTVATYFNAPHQFDDHTLNLLDLLARQASIIMERSKTCPPLQTGTTDG